MYYNAPAVTLGTDSYLSMCSWLKKKKKVCIDILLFDT